jgi:hypothetical protein
MIRVQGAAKGAALRGVKSRPIEEERRPWGSHTLEVGPDTR